MRRAFSNKLLLLLAGTSLLLLLVGLERRGGSGGGAVLWFSLQLNARVNTSALELIGGTYSVAGQVNGRLDGSVDHHLRSLTCIAP